MRLNATSAMQYRLPGEDSWRACTNSMSVSNLLNKSSAVVLEFRYAGVNTTPQRAPSPIRQFILPKVSEAPDYLEIDVAQEVIKELNSDIVYQYSINGSTWYAIDANSTEFSIYSLIGSVTSKIYMRECDINHISDPVIFTVPGRGAAPTGISFDYLTMPEQVLVNGVSNLMEYRFDTATEWIAVESGNLVLDIPAINQIIYVRYKSTSGTAPASNVFTGRISAGAAAPNPMLDYYSERIVNVNTNMEYRIDGGVWNITPSSIMCFNDHNLYGKTIEFRTKATTNLPASAVRTLVVTPLSAAPEISYDYLSSSLNTTAAMQYRIKGSSIWLNCTGALLVESFMSVDAEVIIEVRIKGVASDTPPSEIAEFTLPNLQQAPEIQIDIQREVLFDLDPAVQYEYSTNGSTWVSIPLGDTEFSIYSIIGTRNITLRVRKAATVNSPISVPATFDIAARPNAPAEGLLFVYDNDTELVYLSGWTTQMEYRRAEDSEWMTCSADSVIVNIPETRETYLVRYKSTGGATPAGLAKEVYLDPDIVNEFAIYSLVEGELYYNGDSSTYNISVDFSQSNQGYILIERLSSSGLNITVRDINGATIANKTLEGKSYFNGSGYSGLANPSLYTWIPVTKPSSSGSDTVVYTVTVSTYHYTSSGGSRFRISTGDISNFENTVAPQDEVLMQLRGYAAFNESDTGTDQTLTNECLYTSYSIPQNNDHIYEFTPTRSENYIYLTSSIYSNNDYLVKDLRFALVDAATGTQIYDSGADPSSVITDTAVMGSYSFVNRARITLSIGTPVHIYVYNLDPKSNVETEDLNDIYCLSIGDARWASGEYTAHFDSRITAASGRMSTETYYKIEDNSIPNSARIYEMSCQRTTSLGYNDWYVMNGDTGQMTEGNYGTRVWTQVPFSPRGHGANFDNQNLLNEWHFTFYNATRYSLTLSPIVSFKYYYMIGDL